MIRTLRLEQTDVEGLIDLITHQICACKMAIDIDPEMTVENLQVIEKLEFRQRFLDAVGVTSPLPGEISNWIGGLLSRKLVAVPLKPSELELLFQCPKPKGVN